MLSESVSSDYDSSSESLEDDILKQKPIFIKKPIASAIPKEPSLSKPSHHLHRAEHQHELNQREVTQQKYMDIDDTDNIDPEAEYKAWKEREKGRKARDRALIAEAEKEKEDMVLRQMLRARGENVGNVRDENSENSLQHISLYALEGAELANRDLGELEDAYDHSRPTKYKA